MLGMSPSADRGRRAASFPYREAKAMKPNLVVRGPVFCCICGHQVERPPKIAAGWVCQECYVWNPDFAHSPAVCKRIIKEEVK